MTTRSVRAPFARNQRLARNRFHNFGQHDEAGITARGVRLTRLEVQSLLAADELQDRLVLRGLPGLPSGQCTQYLIAVQAVS